MIKYPFSQTWNGANTLNPSLLKTGARFCYIVSAMAADGLTTQGAALGPPLNTKTDFACMGIPVLNVRQSWDHLIFNMRIPILVRRHLYTETPPWWLKLSYFNQMFTKQNSIIQQIQFRSWIFTPYHFLFHTHNTLIFPRNTLILLHLT